MALRIVALLAFFVAPAAAYAAAPVLGPATTVVDAPLGLRLREGPSLIDPIDLVLYNGETVYEQARPEWNQGISWTYVGVYRGEAYYEGYCATAYLGTYGGWEPTGEAGLKVTAAIGLRLRSGPGLGYAVQRIVPFGTILPATGAANQWGDGYEWTQLTLDGTSVWAATMYLTAI